MHIFQIQGEISNAFLWKPLCPRILNGPCRTLRMSKSDKGHEKIQVLRYHVSSPTEL